MLTKVQHGQMGVFFLAANTSAMAFFVTAVPTTTTAATVKRVRSLPVLVVGLKPFTFADLFLCFM